MLIGLALAGWLATGAAGFVFRSGKRKVDGTVVSRHG